MQPRSNILSKTYKPQPRQVDLDLIGLVGQSQIEALPVYPGDLDCILSDSADDVTFAKVLQPDNEYGQLPHERWLHGTSSPLYLVPRPVEAEPQGICSHCSRRKAPTNQLHLPRIDLALCACSYSPLNSYEQRKRCRQQPEPSEERHDFTSRWHLRKGSWGSQSRFSQSGGRAGLETGDGGFTGNQEACPEAAGHPVLRRRKSSASLNSKNSDFRPYGRHANQWLFGDFSVRAVVRDAWGRTLKRRRVG